MMKFLVQSSPLLRDYIGLGVGGWGGGGGAVLAKLLPKEEWVVDS